MISGSFTRPRFDMHRQDLHSPTASNTAFIAAFFTTSGITLSIGDFSLFTFVAILVLICFAVTSMPMR